MRICEAQFAERGRTRTVTERGKEKKGKFSSSGGVGEVGESSQLPKSIKKREKRRESMRAKRGNRKRTCLPGHVEEKVQCTEGGGKERSRQLARMAEE